MSNIKIKLFAIAKDEAAYIPQWVFHHFYFGFDEIEIWLNDITDNSIQICNTLSKIYPNFKYKIVDDILDKCKEENKSFQYESYNMVLRSEKQNLNFTHIFYLDLDEFWTPRNFQDTIHYFVDKYFYADSISFPWYFDEADHKRKIGDYKFYSSNKLYFDKDQHVKTLVKISDRVVSVNFHNHIIEKGIQIDCEGNILPILDSKTMGGAKISKDILDISTMDKTVSAFVLHTVLRSQVEYLASLLRGRKHVLNDKSPLLKSNRWGFLTEMHYVPYYIDDNILCIYNQKLSVFLDEFKDELFISYNFILNRYDKVIEIFRDYQNFKYFKRLLNNIDLKEVVDIVDKYSYQERIRFWFDKIEIKEYSLEIVGWVVLLESNKHISLRFYDMVMKKFIDGRLSRIDRLDVLNKISNSSPLNCGFKFLCELEYVEFNFNDVNIELLEFEKSTYTVIFGVEYK